MEQDNLVLIKRLSRVMEIELEKPVEEMDDEVVAICADWKQKAGCKRRRRNNVTSFG